MSSNFSCVSYKYTMKIRFYLPRCDKKSEKLFILCVPMQDNASNGI